MFTILSPMSPITFERSLFVIFYNSFVFCDHSRMSETNLSINKTIVNTLCSFLRLISINSSKILRQKSLRQVNPFRPLVAKRQHFPVEGTTFLKYAAEKSKTLPMKLIKSSNYSLGTSESGTDELYLNLTKASY